MESEWVRARFKKYQDGINEEERRHLWQANATAAYASMFDALAGQIAEDVEAYNHLFAAHEDCQASIEPISDGFKIQRGVLGVRVTKKTGTTIIAVEYVRPERLSGAGFSGGSDRLDVAPDEQGNIRYKHKEHFLDVSGASERILDRILC